MSQLRRNTVKLVADLMLWTSAALLAFPLRVFRGFAEELETMVAYAGIAALVGAAAFIAFRLPRQSWREVSLDDLLRMLQAIGVAAFTLFASGLVWHQVSGFPRTVPLIQAALGVVFMGGTRLAARLSHERRGERSAREDGTQDRVLVVGAGGGGASMAREMRRHPKAGLTPVGFLDDDPSKRGMSIAGLPVLGTIDRLAEVTAENDIDQVLIAMPSAPGRRTRRVVELARVAGVQCRILPGGHGDPARRRRAADAGARRAGRGPVAPDPRGARPRGRRRLRHRARGAGHRSRWLDRLGAGSTGRAARSEAAGAARTGREQPARDPAGAASRRCPTSRRRSSWATCRIV